MSCKCVKKKFILILCFIKSGWERDRRSLETSLDSPLHNEKQELNAFERDKREGFKLVKIELEKYKNNKKQVLKLYNFWMVNKDFR